MSGVLQRRWRVSALLGFTLGMLLLQAAAASASPSSVPGPVRVGPTLRSQTELIMASPIRGAGQNINGFVPAANNGFQPITCTPAGSTNCVSNYPAGNPPPPPGTWTTRNGIFAGNLRANPVPNPNNVTLLLYCIDIHTPVGSGYGYTLGSWEASGMPNVGYVARILNFLLPERAGSTLKPGHRQ